MHFVKKIPLLCLMITPNMLAMEQNSKSIPGFKPVLGAETFTINATSNPSELKIVENGTRETCGHLLHEGSSITGIEINQEWEGYNKSITKKCLEHFEATLATQGAIEISIRGNILTPTRLEILQHNDFTPRDGNIYAKQLATIRSITQQDMANPNIRTYFKTQVGFEHCPDTEIDEELMPYRTKKITSDKYGSITYDGAVVVDKNSMLRAMALYRISRDDAYGDEFWITQLIPLGTQVGTISTQYASNNPFNMLLTTLVATAHNEKMDSINYIPPEYTSDKNEHEKIKLALTEHEFKKPFISTAWSKRLTQGTKNA